MKKELTKDDEKLMDKLANVVVSRRLTAMAVFFLETSKPLSFIGSQFMVFMQPFIQTMFNFDQYDRVMELMEDKNNIEILIQRIEKKEAERKNSKSI